MAIGAPVAPPADSTLPLYVSALVELSVDGAPADSARVEGAFGEALTAAGLNRISAAAAGIASPADAEKGAGHPAADLVVIARIESRKLAAGIGGTSLVRYEASADARVLATETGELLGTVTAEGPGIDVDPTSAARIAGAHAARTLAERLTAQLPALLAAPQSVEIVVSGFPDQAEADHARDHLQRAADVTGVRVLTRAGRGARSKTTLRVAVRGLSTAALARRIDETRGLGLRVEGHTLRRIAAVYDPTRRVQLAVKVARLTNATGEPAEDAMVGPLTRVLRTALGGSPGVAVDAEQPPFTVEGAISYVGQADVAIALRLKGPSGAVIARARVVGPGQRFSRTVRRAARALGREGLARAREDAEIRRIAGIPLRPPKGPAVPPETLVGLDVRPAAVGAPLLAEVRLARDPGDARLVVMGGERAWVERPGARSADGLSRVFEGPPLDAPGALDVRATLQTRQGGRWHAERVLATGVVRPELVARWSTAAP